jgi:hypothetical protein
MTTERRPLVAEGLSGLEEHINAMLDAATPSEAAAVLASAQQRYLTGHRVTCDRHPGPDMTLSELLTHTARRHHEAGDVRPADPDPVELRRFGGDL